MKQTFGSFLRKKRLERFIKLNTFARLVGISAVYESYIETGKRPAPSPGVLNKIIKQLRLSTEETEKLLLLAAETHHHPTIPSDLIDYINENDYIIETLRLAKEYQITEKTWLEFMNQITTEST